MTRPPLASLDKWLLIGLPLLYLAFAPVWFFMWIGIMFVLGSGKSWVGETVIYGWASWAVVAPAACIAAWVLARRRRMVPARLTVAAPLPWVGFTGLIVLLGSIF